MQKNPVKKKQMLVVPVKVREFLISKVERCSGFIVRPKSGNWERIPYEWATKEPAVGDKLTVYKTNDGNLLGWDINGEVQYRLCKFKKVNVC